MLQTPLRVHLHPTGSFLHAGIAERLVNQHLQDTGLALQVYAEQFNAWIGPLSKTLIIALIPAFALMLKAAHAFQRRYYVEHLVFACHVFAFWLILIMVLGTVLQGLLPMLLHRAGLGSLWIFGEGFLLSGAMVVGIGVYLYKAFECRYEQAAWKNGVKGMMLSLGLIFVFMVYRALLFFVAFSVTT